MWNHTSVVPNHLGAGGVGGSANQFSDPVVEKSGKLDLSARNVRFWPAVGVVLDVLVAVEARVADAAALLSISTGNLIDFLQTDPKVWQEANRLRGQFGHKPLR